MRSGDRNLWFSSQGQRQSVRVFASQRGAHERPGRQERRRARRSAHSSVGSPRHRALRFFGRLLRTVLPNPLPYTADVASEATCNLLNGHAIRPKLACLDDLCPIAALCVQFRLPPAFETVVSTAEASDCDPAKPLVFDIDHPQQQPRQGYES